MAYISFQPSDHFDVKLWTGNGSSQTITGYEFQPDLAWIKARTSTGWHDWTDAVRGVTKSIFSNSANAEDTAVTSLTAFTSDGYSLGTNSQVNANGINYVAWNWKAGAGQGSSNTDGSINTTYTSANTTAGFSISTYSGTGSAATIGHGLGAVPQVMIVKNTYQAENWIVYHHDSNATPEDKYLHLNTTDALGDSAGMWNDTAPTSSVFSVGTSTSVNQAGGTFVAYCFAEKKGFSKFGSYTGNGNADGAFIYTGFKPAWIMFRDLRSGQSWNMYDNKRSPINFVDERLRANLNGAEVHDTGYSDMDFLSNGFKLRSSWDQTNASGETIIFMAFAEAPLVSSNGVPATAR